MRNPKLRKPFSLVLAVMLALLCCVPLVASTATPVEATGYHSAALDNGVVTAEKIQAELDQFYLDCTTLYRKGQIEEFCREAGETFSMQSFLDFGEKSPHQWFYALVLNGRLVMQKSEWLQNWEKRHGEYSQLRANVYPAIGAEPANGSVMSVFKYYSEYSWHPQSDLTVLFKGSTIEVYNHNGKRVSQLDVAPLKPQMAWSVNLEMAHARGQNPLFLACGEQERDAVLYSIDRKTGKIQQLSKQMVMYNIGSDMVSVLYVDQKDTLRALRATTDFVDDLELAKRVKQVGLTIADGSGWWSSRDGKSSAQVTDKSGKTYTVKWQWRYEPYQYSYQEVLDSIEIQTKGESK